MAQSVHYLVKQVVELTGVTARALHHYDQIGLLVPSRTAAGYRLYSEGDLLRLHQILVGRELGLSLEAIRAFLDDPIADRAQLLRRQRDALVFKRQSTDAMIAAIDLALSKLKEDEMTTTEDELKAMFGGFSPADFDDEVSTRWGDTDAFAESARRTKGYAKHDWEAIRDESADIFGRMAKVMADETSPSSAAATALADEYRMHIDRWFYPCSKEMHAQLASLYETDGRFAETFNQHADGLADFVAAAIRANLEQT